ncbi:MAG: PilZ domain-containing protein [Candidatus Acidiferrales bacterium]
MDAKAEQKPGTRIGGATVADRRSSERFPCRGRVELLRLPPAPRETIYGTIHNLSEGGCYVETASVLEVGARLAMVLRLEALELRLIAQVRSVKTDPKSWAGLEFVGISPEGFAKLRALIDSFAKAGKREEEKETTGKEVAG